MRQEIITRRNLPHWYMAGAAHFVTFRLAGTLPREVLEELKRTKDRLLRRCPSGGIPANEQRARIHKQLFAAYDKYLDANREIDWLANPRVASKIRSSLYFLHEDRYHLLAYCIMPNHVHVLFLPFDLEESADQTLELETEDSKSPLSAIMHSLKGYTAHEANKIMGRKGQFWQHESYDRWVRDDDELERIVEYINANPVKAGLARSPQDWFWGSAHDRFLADGETSGWLGLESRRTSRKPAR